MLCPLYRKQSKNNKAITLMSVGHYQQIGHK